MADSSVNGSMHAMNGSGGGRGGGRGGRGGRGRPHGNRSHGGRGRGKVASSATPRPGSLLARMEGIDAAPAASNPTSVASVPGSSRQFHSSGILEGYTSGKRFAETSLSAQTKAAIPYEFMSEIQSATIETALTGKDILAQAKTGTGKTAAFLVPIIERLLQAPPQGREVSALVMSPTRELAMQIATECGTLLKGSSLGVQTVYGGTNINTERNRLKQQRCDILVATPGRLKDHLQSGNLALNKIRFLVLDEADRLLDMGFRPDIERILSFLPDRRAQPRQALLFSATIPPAVMQVKSLVLLPGHAHISTIKPEEVNAHLHVTQHSLIAPVESHLSVLYALIHAEVEKHGQEAKIMAFFPTARQTGLAYEVFIAIPGAKQALGGAWELHSRMSQGARTKATDAFRKAKGGLLFTSDVSGRGMDFPDVSLVIQIGMPMAPEDYVHRLGRTARAGASGSGVIVLAPFEQSFLSLPGMRDMPLTPHPSQAQLSSPDAIAASLGAYEEAVAAALKGMDEKSLSQAYVAFMGFYNGKHKITGLGKPEVVQMANHYARAALKWPHRQPPPMLRKTVGMMGMKGIPGLHVVSVLPE